MASSNKTGLGINKKRSKQVLKTSIDVLQEYSKWAKDEDEDSYLAMKDLHTIVYDDWREQGRQVLSAHVRNPIEDYTLLEKNRKVNRAGVREIHYRVKQ
jgi:hypothetical protein